MPNGDVTIEGVMAGEMDRSLANIAANSVFGVHSVTDNLTLSKEWRAATRAPPRAALRGPPSLLPDELSGHLLEPFGASLLRSRWNGADEEEGALSCLRLRYSSSYEDRLQNRSDVAILPHKTRVQ